MSLANKLLAKISAAAAEVPSSGGGSSAAVGVRAVASGHSSPQAASSSSPSTSTTAAPPPPAAAAGPFGVILRHVEKATIHSGHLERDLGIRLDPLTGAVESVAGASGSAQHASSGMMMSPAAKAQVPVHHIIISVNGVRTVSADMDTTSASHTVDGNGNGGLSSGGGAGSGSAARIQAECDKPVLGLQMRLLPLQPLTELIGLYDRFLPTRHAKQKQMPQPQQGTGGAGADAKKGEADKHQPIFQMHCTGDSGGPNKVPVPLFSATSDNYDLLADGALEEAVLPTAPPAAQLRTPSSTTTAGAVFGSADAVSGFSFEPFLAFERYGFLRLEHPLHGLWKAMLARARAAKRALLSLQRKSEQDRFDEADRKLQEMLAGGLEEGEGGAQAKDGAEGNRNGTSPPPEGAQALMSAAERQALRLRQQQLQATQHLLNGDVRAADIFSGGSGVSGGEESDPFMDLLTSLDGGVSNHNGTATDDDPTLALLQGALRHGQHHGRAGGESPPPEGAAIGVRGPVGGGIIGADGIRIDHHSASGTSTHATFAGTGGAATAPGPAEPVTFRLAPPQTYNVCRAASVAAMLEYNEKKHRDDKNNKNSSSDDSSATSGSDDDDNASVDEKKKERKAAAAKKRAAKEAAEAAALQTLVAVHIPLLFRSGPKPPPPTADPAAEQAAFDATRKSKAKQRVATTTTATTSSTNAANGSKKSHQNSSNNNANGGGGKISNRSEKRRARRLAAPKDARLGGGGGGGSSSHNNDNNNSRSKHDDYHYISGNGNNNNSSSNKRSSSEICKDFMRGTCHRNDCRYSHDYKPSSSRSRNRNRREKRSRSRDEDRRRDNGGGGGDSRRQRSRSRDDRHRRDGPRREEPAASKSKNATNKKVESNSNKPSAPTRPERL